MIKQNIMIDECVIPVFAIVQSYLFWKHVSKQGTRVHYSIGYMIAHHDFKFLTC